MAADPRAAALKRVLDLAEVLGAESGATDGERKNALRLGQRLIDRWGFSLSEVEAAGREEALRRAPQVVQDAVRAPRRPPTPAGNPFGPFGSPTQTPNYGTTGAPFGNGGTFVHIIWG